MLAIFTLQATAVDRCDEISHADVAVSWNISKSISIANIIQIQNEQKKLKYNLCKSLNNVIFQDMSPNQKTFRKFYNMCTSKCCY